MLTGTLTPVPVAPYIAAIKTAKQKQIKTERQDKNKREKRSTMMFGKRTGEAPEPLPWNGVEFRINALALCRRRGTPRCLAVVFDFFF